MLICAFSTRGSKVAAAVLALLLLLCVPIITGVHDAITQSSLFLVIAVLIGAALGWLAGDTIVQSPRGGRFLVAIAVLVTIALGLFLPISSLPGIETLSDLRLYVVDLFALPLPDNSAIPSVRYATVAFALVTVAALTLSPRASMRDVEAPARGTAWNAVGSIATALTLLLGVHTFVVSQVRWQQEVTIRAIAEENADKPYASRHCLESILKLDKGQLSKIYVREGVTLQFEQADYVRRCFADQDTPDQEKLLRKSEGNPAQSMLTAKGAALLAQRVNYTLTKDGLIASLLKYKIGDKDLVTSELKARLCGVDKALVETMSKTPLGEQRRPLYDENDSLYWLVVTSGFCPASR